jgi:hypothetical protein
MELQQGDWVWTEKGEAGQVVMIGRLTAFVAINMADRRKMVISYLKSQLTKIDQPARLIAQDGPRIAPTGRGGSQHLTGE